MTDFNALFEHGLLGKREQHWVMCFASYYGNVQKLAQEHNLNEQTVRNYGKTYCLYKDLRDWVRFFWTYAQVQELRQLRRDVDYSNWLQVAIRYYHEDASKRIELYQALDFLRAGTDTSARVFAGIVGGNEMTRVKAFTSAYNGIWKALVYFPFSMTKRERRIMKQALHIAEKRGK